MDKENSEQLGLDWSNRVPPWRLKGYPRLKHLMDYDPYLFDGLKKDREKKFKTWLPYNMHIYDAFVKFAYELNRLKNRRYYSARAIWERLRWETMLQDADTDSDCKISDLNMPFVSWLSMEAEPSLKGMFKKRRSKMADPDCHEEEEVEKEDHFNSDAEADADALASAGWGTDEDYGSASDIL